ncbi:MAG: phosphatidate cytidylyltransferase [Victivallaceae bacterium]|nr:phosphatidate cytidylyltransferase [Victivallaceae bacterium]
MLKYRMISFPLLLGLIWAIFFLPKYGNYLFIVAATAVTALTLFECGKLFNIAQIWNLPMLSAFLGGLTAFFALITTYFFSFPEGIVRFYPVVFLLLIVLLLPHLVIWSCVLFRSGKYFKCILGSFGIFATLGISLILLEMLYYVNGDSENPASNLLLYVMLTVKAMDTGGYIFGTLAAKTLPGGSHKIAPEFSPKKSWEGFLGGMVLSVAVSMLFYVFGSRSFSWQLYLISGIALGFLSFIGDLTESGIKRHCNVKDSGDWIPGMGGMFDVVDSFIYVGPAAAIVYAVCRIVGA